MSHRELGDSVERINPRFFRTKEKYLLFLRHVFAYEHVIRMSPADHSVLEVGCGEGYGANILSTHFREVVAIDASSDSVAHARQRYPDSGCDFRQCADSTMPFQPATFDTVVSFQVIEHVQDDHAFLCNLRRVVKPGGSVWITTPNRTHRVRPGQALWNPFHVREYVPDELRTLVASVFDDFDLMGVVGTTEINEIEHRRVARGLSLRKLIPHGLKFLWEGPLDRFSTSQFEASASGLANGLDLMCHARVRCD